METQNATSEHSLAKFCRVCGSETLQRCSRCKTAFYCGREHIVADWPRHKAECNAITSGAKKPLNVTGLGEARATGVRQVDAILFAVDETRPRMIKVNVYDMPGDPDEYEQPWQKLEKKPWFSDSAFVRTMIVRTKWAQGPPLEHTKKVLAIRYDDDSLVNHSKPNQCIHHVTEGKAFHPWAGNFYVVRAESMLEEKYFDANVEEDLPALINYFKDYGKFMPYS